ncbi:MAG: hypothetical protein LLG15_06310 [Betaproteobacteria bacterium]|nr:hypothetical protein [Betaproteobacteria bacterium]
MIRIRLPKSIKGNLQFLGMPLILLGLSIITGVGLFFGSMAYERHNLARYAEANQQLSTARQSNTLARARQENINRYLTAYQSLMAEKQINGERRQDWIDTLSHIREQRKLFPVEYDLAARRPYKFTDIPSSSALNLFASRMNVRLPLLHEGDIVTLLDDLRSRKVGLFVVDHCNIVRDPKANDTPPQFVQNLSAECAVDWITVETTSPSPTTKPSGK